MTRSVALSGEAERLLRWIATRGGDAPVDRTASEVLELVGMGLGEVVAIGIDEPTMYLTPEGLRLGRTSSIRPPTVSRR